MVLSHQFSSAAPGKICVSNRYIIKTPFCSSICMHILYIHLSATCICFYLPHPQLPFLWSHFYFAPISFSDSAILLSPILLHPFLSITFHSFPFYCLSVLLSLAFPFHSLCFLYHFHLALSLSILFLYLIDIHKYKSTNIITIKKNSQTIKFFFKKTKQLKQMLESPKLEFIMEGHNGLSARIVQEAGKSLTLFILTPSKFLNINNSLTTGYLHSSPRFETELAGGEAFHF